MFPNSVSEWLPRHLPNKNFRSSTKCACQVEHLTHDLGGMEYEVEFISLSQELKNFFSLNLEL